MTDQHIGFVKDADLDELIWLWKYCFTDSDEFVQWYFREYYRKENTLGAYQDGQLVSSLQMIPYQIMLRNQPVDLSYIVGVDTAPESRQGGLTKDLLIACLSELRSRRESVSILMPFKAVFYTKYQWAFCYFHYKYRGNIEELKGFKSDYGKMVRVNPLEYKEALNYIYTHYHRGLNGYVIRDDQKWQYLLEEMMMENIHCYLVQEGDGFQGYVLYHLNGSHILVREMGFTNYSAQKRILSFLYGHRSHVKTIEWDGPINESLPFNFPDSKEMTTVYPFMMARIVDVIQAFKKFSYDSDLAEIKIQVTDPLLSWNNGIFKLAITNGVPEIEETTVTESTDITIDVEGLTQLFFGAVSCDELRFQERMALHNEAVYAQWKQVWPKQVNYMNEYY